MRVTAGDTLESIAQSFATLIGADPTGNLSALSAGVALIVVNSVMAGSGLAHGPNALNVSFIRPGLTNGPLHNWQRTYEMDI